MECTPRSRGEVEIQCTGHPVLDDVDRTGDRIGGDRHAAGHGLEVDEAEGIGPARKHHDVGRRQVHREILAEPIAQIYRVRKLLLEPRSFGAVADHDLGAGPVHFQECLDILFDGDSADIGGDRARQREKNFRVRFEYLCVDAAAPSRQVLEPMRFEIAAHRGGAHHAALGRTMEPTQRPIGDAQRQREARAQILRELRVIGGGKSHAMA